MVSYYCCRKAQALHELTQQYWLCPRNALYGGYRKSKRCVVRRKAYLLTRIAFGYQAYDVDPFWNRWVVWKPCRHEIEGLQLHCCAGCVQGLYAQPIHSDEKLHLRTCKRLPHMHRGGFISPSRPRPDTKS